MGLSVFVRSSALAPQAQGKLELLFDGFNDDKRELWQIPEVRRFVARLDAEEEAHAAGALHEVEGFAVGVGAAEEVIAVVPPSAAAPAVAISSSRWALVAPLTPTAPTI